MQKKYLFLTILFVISNILLNYSCDVTDPNDFIPPGKRNYTWTYYNLNNMFTSENLYRYIGGTSPTNIWICGDDYQKNVIHFNGEKLKLYNNTFPVGLLANFAAEGSLHTWFSGKNGSMYKETNGEISFYQDLDTLAYYKFINSIYGENENNLIGAGLVKTQENSNFKACIWKFVNNKWIACDTLLKENSQFLDVKRGKVNGENRIFLTSFEGREALYMYDFNKFHKIYSLSKPDEAMIHLLELDNQVYFWINKKLYTYDNYGLVSVRDFSNEDILGYRAFGRTLNDLFLHSSEGIKHYNGKDVEMLYKFPKKGNMWNALFFKNEVFFILVHSSNETALIHGQLK